MTNYYHLLVKMPDASDNAVSVNSRAQFKLGIAKLVTDVASTFSVTD